MKELEKCKLCPRNCSINRYQELGFCGASAQIKVADYRLHQWEEPVLSGSRGSGTVFFSHCNLKCIFCQNHEISISNQGVILNEEQLAFIFLELQKEGAHNINLVTPTHYVPQIASVLRKIKNKKLFIPVVYNTSSYENVSTIQMMEGLVDVYLADLKYFDDDLAKKYSHCKDYFHFASLAIDEMFSQVGSIQLKGDLMIKGVIVRVLVLPGHVDDAKKIISYLFQTYGNHIFISIMNQYTPIKHIQEFPQLNHTLTDNEYAEVVNYSYDLGVRCAFIQEGDCALQSFIPDFDLHKVELLLDQNSWDS